MPDQDKKLQNALKTRFGDAPTVPEAAEVLVDMASRGVCRAYAEDPVDMNLVRTLCAVALSSPSKSDLQQRDIVIVSDPEIRAQLDEITGFDWQPAAPVLLVFCANHARFHLCHEMAGVEMTNDHLDGFFNAAVDAGIALSAFVTAAERIGLGCCPLSVLRNQADLVSRLLDLPDRVIPVAGLTLGWPARTPRIAPRLSLAGTVHENRFSSDPEAAIREYDQRRGPPDRQRNPARFGEKQDYGWSDDKARQYADPQRSDWGAFVRAKKFNLE
ncbi:MAG: nitroreductase family protein [Pseudomonadota bacterium]